MNKHLIFIVAYNHENFLEKVLDRLPKEVAKDKYKILIIDDASKDNTSINASNWKKRNSNYSIEILKNPKNQGYGGNQKIGFQYAINNKFKTVTLLHGDGQYAPEIIVDMINEFEKTNSNLLLGSRMMIKKNALKGKMPLYKFIGNIFLTKMQNFILKVNLSEFHTGYRIYDVEKLNQIPFYLNSNDFHFDTEIIIQFIIMKYKIHEYPIPTYYGDEISYVNGFKYAFNVIKQSILSRIFRLGIFYDKKYDLYSDEIYMDKTDFKSSHLYALKHINNNENIIDFGSSDGHIIEKLREKKCLIKGIDIENTKQKNKFDEFEEIDLNKNFPKNISKFNTFLLLDILEHLNNADEFLQKLSNNININDKTKIIASTGNIAFIVIRIMLLLGEFNYGKRGILDKSHTKLYTFYSFKKLFIDNGFEIKKVIGIPAPFPLALGDNFFSKILININSFLIKISKTIFSYQIFIIAKPRVNVQKLLNNSIKIK